MFDQYVLQVENLRKSYKSSRRERIVAVNDISFNVREGEILALLGPNGAGKTTTIKMLSGLLIPSTGAVRINDLDPYKGREALKYIGSVLEGNRNLYWRLTSYENLMYFGVLKGMRYRQSSARAYELLEQFNLTDKTKEQVRNLSRGMQQRLAIAVSLMHKPKLLLLDEPSLGLDAKSIVEVKKMVKQLVKDGVGVLLTTHQFDIAEDLADRIAIIDKGKIIKEATPKDLLKEHANNVYEIELLEPLSNVQVEALRVLPFKLDYADSCVTVSCLPERLFEVFSLIQPLKLQEVKRVESDLNSVFLKLTG